jgi:hypothetical protein
VQLRAGAIVRSRATPTRHRHRDRTMTNPPPHTEEINVAGGKLKATLKNIMR